MSGGAQDASERSRGGTIRRLSEAKMGIDLSIPPHRAGSRPGFPERGRNEPATAMCGEERVDLPDLLWG
jgi:hypothetical protein